MVTLSPSSWCLCLAGVIARWREAITPPEGKPGHRTTDNIISKARQGTSLAYTLDRLRREYPALYERALLRCSGHRTRLSISDVTRHKNWTGTPFCSTKPRYWGRGFALKITS